MFAANYSTQVPVPGTFPGPMVPEQWTEGPAGVHLHRERERDLYNYNYNYIYIHNITQL